MAKVFISYSRKDIEFAKQLTAELQKSSLDFWIDWEGIPPTVDWWREIEKGIEEADIFLFLISPDSAASKVCGQEIDYAIKNAKRIIPIVVRDIKADKTPTQLSHLNWIFFRKDDDFDAAVKKLMTAIQTDYEWVATHRRLQVKALEWERNNKESSFLLRGKDLQDAEMQLATNTSKEPHPTDLQREFVFKSRQATDRARRITTGISAAGIVALAALAIFGFVMAGRATVSAEDARNKASVALTAEAKAKDAQAEAEISQKKAEAESRIARSGRLTLESTSSLNEFPQRALLLALEAARINQDANEPVQPDAEEALRLAAKRVTGIGLPGFANEVSLLQFTDDNQWLVTGSALGGEIKIWNFNRLMGKPAYQPFPISFPVTYDEVTGELSSRIYLSPHTTWLVLDKPKETQIWKIDTQDEAREPLTFQGKIEFANSKDDLEILEKQSNKVVLWRIDLETLSKKELASFAGSFAALSRDYKYLVTDDPQKGLLLWKFSPPSTTPVPLTSTHIADYKSLFIDPGNRWLILFQDVPQEAIQIPAYDAFGNASGTTPWSSTNILLIPLGGRSNPQPFTVELDVAVDTAVIPPKFSPDGNALVFVGQSNPDAYGASRQNFGILKFNDLEYAYLVSSKKEQTFNVLSFINKDWLYISSYDSAAGSQRNTLVDFRGNDLLSSIDLATPLLIGGDGQVRFSEDGKSMLSETGELIDFQQLDLNQTIVLNPAPKTSAVSEQSELLLKLTNNPRSVGLEDAVSVSAQSPNKEWFAAGTRDGSLRLWNNVNPWNSSNIRLPEAANYIAFSNDNQWMAINSALWRLEDGRPAQSYPFEEGALTKIAVFSPDSRWLAYIQDTGAPPDAVTYFPPLRAKVIDLEKLSSEDKVNTAVISRTDGTYNTIQFSADSRWLIVKDEQLFLETPTTTAFLYDLETRKSYQLPYPVTSFAFTPDQKHVTFISINYQTTDGVPKAQNPEVWKLPAEAGEQFEKIGEIEDNDFSTLSPNGRWLLSAPSPFNPETGMYEETSRPGKLWDVNCVTEKRGCVPFSLPVSQAGFSPDSSRLVVGYRSNGDAESLLDFDIWSLPSQGEPVKVQSGRTNQSAPSIGKRGDLLIFSSSFLNYTNPAGLFTTWGGYDGIGINITTFDGYGRVVFGGFGGGFAMTGSYQTDYNVDAFVLEDPDQTPSKPISLRGHESNISASQVSPNEKFALTYSGAARDNGGSAEMLLRLWDMEKMRLDPATKPVVLPLDLGPDGSISAIAFSPDSRWIYVVDNTNTLYYFPISIDDLEKQACIAVGRNLIINEWERFFPGKDYRKTCENLPEHPSVLLQATSP